MTPNYDGLVMLELCGGKHVFVLGDCSLVSISTVVKARRCRSPFH